MYHKNAQTDMLVIMSMVVDPPQENNSFVKGANILLTRLAPPTSKKRYIKMLFIPTIIKKRDSFVNIFFTSINQ